NTSTMFSFHTPAKIRKLWFVNLPKNFATFGCKYGTTNSNSLLVIAFDVQLITASLVLGVDSLFCLQRFSRKIGRNTNLTALFRATSTAGRKSFQSGST